MPFIILFDGMCNLCNGAVQFVIKHDPAGKFKFAALQSESGQALLRQTGLSQTEFDTFVYFKEDRYVVKSTAVLQLLRELGGGWKLLYVLMVIPRPLRDFVYDRIAQSRFKIFGRRANCMVPTPELQSRFIL